MFALSQAFCSFHLFDMLDFEGQDSQRKRNLKVIHIFYTWFLLSCLWWIYLLGPGWCPRNRIQVTKDFKEHAALSDLLLGHYTMQWKDREVYWMARTRAQGIGDLCCVIIDSYDHAKMMLPRFPRKRTPKSTTYETVKRCSSDLKYLFYGSNLFILFRICYFFQGPEVSA